MAAEGNAAAGCSKRKSVVSDTFRVEWEREFLFVEADRKASNEAPAARCLVCLKVLTTLKKFHLSRHYNTLHAGALAGEDRDALLERLKAGSAEEVEADECIFSGASVRASYKVAALLTKRLKPLSDGEFIKDCIVAVAETVVPDQLAKFEAVSLSRRTIGRRVLEMAEDLREQLVCHTARFLNVSLALDESTDVSSTAQLAIFVRGVDEKLEVTEELLELEPMKATSTGLDILTSVEEVVENTKLKWENLVSVATDGTPAMLGKKDVFAGRLKAKLELLVIKEQFISIHCMIHRENLCSQNLKMPHVMELVVKTVNKLRVHGLAHRQFSEFLKDLECEYTDIPYFTAVRWLSRGKVLQRFFDLREPIALFMEMRGEKIPQLKDAKWVEDLAFLSDVVHHLNILNCSLQGPNQLITQMVDNIKSCKDKLDLWQLQMSTGCEDHFTSLKPLREMWLPQDLTKYADQLKNLKKAFVSGFDEIGGFSTELELFSTPFSVDVLGAPAHFQLELIDLKMTEN